MKNKKIIIIFTIILLVIIIGGFFIIKYVKTKKLEQDKKVVEYTPQEEITEDQLRRTIVSLYFPSKESQQLEPEARLLDIKELINDACDKLVNLLIEGPKNEKTMKVIPENTKLNKSYMEKDCVTLDFSSEFLNYDKNNEKSKENLIYSIVNTVTQLTEVNEVKILIDGKTNEEFDQTYLRKIN